MNQQAVISSKVSIQHAPTVKVIDTLTIGFFSFAYLMHVGCGVCQELLSM